MPLSTGGCKMKNPDPAGMGAGEPAMAEGIGVFATWEKDHAFSMRLAGDALDSGRDLHR
jgi:hypothetical protein